MRRIALASALVAIAACCSRQTVVAQRTAAAWPTPPPVDDLSSCKIPSDVAASLPPDPYGQRPFFDSYSWQAFAAMICDAAAGQRGTPDPGHGKDGKGPRVFQTLKSAWEVFHAGSVTTDWNKYEDKTYNPCGADAQNGDLVLASVSKFIDTEEVGAGHVLIGPLPAQNRTYVHYLTQYNETSFNHIVQVLGGMRPSNSQFPDGSVNVKSAWVEMKGLNPDHFYVRNAWIRSPDGNCQQTEVGLIGLHIVQKTPSRPRWIWSTFEQVENTPDSDATCPLAVSPYTFHDTTCKRMPDHPPNENEPYAPPKIVFNVQRVFHTISGNTKDTNQKYQGKFTDSSKWKYYELVMTQWPIKDQDPVHAGDPDYTFPGTGPSSAFANTVMETFFQGQITLSCMGCHGRTANQTDFVWSLQVEPLASRAKAFGELRKTIVGAGIDLQ
jgi:hypothetical protein